MLKDLFERQAAIQARVGKYSPTREVFEEFLKAGVREDSGFFWEINRGARQSRYNWGRRENVITADGQRVIVEAFTDPKRYKYGWEAGDIPKALIDVRVSLPENPTVGKKFELPPVSALLEQNPVFSPQDLDKLEEDFEEIVPLIRALLPQG